MKKSYRLFIVSVFAGFIITGCSEITEIFNSTKESGTETSESEGKETDVNTKSKADRNFYNKYIDVLNKLSPSVDEVQKYYLTNVPEPSAVKRNSTIYVIAADVYLSILSRNYKELKRSLFEEGELSKLEADNETMKNEIEHSFKNVLAATENYIKNAENVLEYYKSSEYKNDLTNVKPYDELMKSGYRGYKDKLEVFIKTLDKYKPPRIKRNPEEYSNPDEKAVAILQNTLENTIDEAGLIYEKLEKFEKNSDPDPIIEALADFEKNFEKNKNEVLSAPFTEKSNYLKFGFEDYFSKTVTDFIKNTGKFVNNAGSLNENDFNREYDYTVNYYNYLVQAYNSTINNAGNFIVY